jgi:polyisoprenoid-binding protein YceI
MTEMVRAEPQALSEMTGAWKLDPSRTTIQLQTKSMWILKVDGTLRCVTATFSARTSSTSGTTRPWSSR